MLFKSVLIFVGDSLFPKDCLECHKKHLQEVLDRLNFADLTMTASKYKFAVEEIKYLGHIVTKSRITMNP